MNSLIEVTQTVLFTLARTGRLFIFCFRPGKGAGPAVLDFLSGVHDLNDRSLVENLYKGRSARLGMHYSDLQSLRLVQDRRAAVVVDSFDANSSRYFHNIVLSFHRPAYAFR